MKIKRIEKGSIIPTADFEVPGSHAYYMGNGIVSHNTSTSIYMDSSASVLPVYDSFFKEDNKNGSIPVAAKFLKENPIGYGKTFPKHTAKEIIDVVSELQKFIDTGCSMELIFDQRKEGFKAKDLYEAIHYAHSKGIKAIYYIRSIKNNTELENRPEADCVACAG